MRNLTKDEVEARVSQCSEKGAALLLYKNARCDMAILDETFGQFGWQRTHEFKDGKLYCTVSVKSPGGEWVSKEDVGTESNMEADKGQASDAFKRACFNWGIGRELYTAPSIWIPANKTNMVQSNGKWKCYDRFKVDKFSVSDGRVSELEISNKDGECVFKWQAYSPESLRESVRKGVQMCAKEYDLPEPLVAQIVENEHAVSIGSANETDLEKMRSFLIKAFKGEVSLKEV